MKLSKISIVTEKLDFKTEQITKEIDVYKDRYGIPHVIADSEDDVFFALGFIQAYDRMWQLDYLRRVAKGQLAEIIGKEAIPVDKYFRALKIADISKRVVKNLDPQSKMILESYSKGINFYLEKFNRRLPIEFSTLQYKPEPWTPEDCIAIGRLLAFNMSFSFWLDVTFGEIANKIGYEKAKFLVPNDYPYVAMDTIIDSARFTNRFAFSKNEQFVRLSNARFVDLNSFKLIQKYFPSVAMFGSNTWAVQYERLNKKGSILASDPHLTLQLPPFWYQVHLTSKDLNLIGLFLPGIPFPLIGRNDNIAWGTTVAMIDDCDFFVHRVDSTGRFVLDSANRKIRINFQLDTIKVKGESPHIYYRRMLGNSVIISDFLLFYDSVASPKLFEFKPKGKFRQDYCLTFKWTGNFITNEVKGIYQIIKAKNWGEFAQVQRHWGSPALNFSYADKFGNIGILTAGIVPQRINVNPNFPNTTWQGGGSWYGYSRLETEFRVYNPPSRFVLNSNNPLVPATGFLSNYWSDPHRAFRLKQLLAINKPNEIISMTIIQNEVHSLQAQNFLKQTLPVLKSKQQYLGTKERKAINLLEKWDFALASNSVPASIYQMFITKFIELTLKDDLGETYNLYTYIDFIPTRIAFRLLQDTSNIFFDDINTAEMENKDEIILRSFKAAILALSKEFGNQEIESWEYGKWHKLTLKHVFAQSDFLLTSFALGPVPYGGNNSTINYAGVRLYAPGKVEIGASARFVADMSDSVVYWILPGGNSGQNMSDNFSDQFNLWLNGSLIEVPFSKNPSPKSKIFVTFRPKN